MLNLIQVGEYKFYVGSPEPKPQPVTELRAWVENPLSKYDNEPCFMLCEIHSVSKAEGFATVKEVNAAYSYNIPLSLIHCVHTFDVTNNRLLIVHGEPK